MRLRLNIGKISAANVKIIGPVTKAYEKQIKGYAFMMDSSSACKLQFPKDEKQYLGLIQPYLVLQIYIPKSKSFTIELLLSDSSTVTFKLASRLDTGCSLQPTLKKLLLIHIILVFL